VERLLTSVGWSITSNRPPSSATMAANRSKLLVSPLPDYDHSASLSAAMMFLVKKSPLTFRSSCELRVARDAAGRVHKRSAFATCVEDPRQLWATAAAPPTATVGNSRWGIGLPAVLGRVPCQSTCGCYARKPATPSPNIPARLHGRLSPLTVVVPRRSRRELELSNEKLMAAVDGRSCI